MKQPTLIKTIKQLKIELSLLDALSKIEIAIKTIKKGDNIKCHPLDHQYISMHCSIAVVDMSDSRYVVSVVYLSFNVLSLNVG